MNIQNREIHGTRFDEGCEPQRANNGGVLLWFLIIPLAVIGFIAYVYGVSW